MIYKINKQNQTKHWIDLSPIYIHCLILKLKINIIRKNTEQDIPGAPAGERDTTKQKQKVLESEDGHSSQRWQKYLYKVSINYDILYTVLWKKTKNIWYFKRTNKTTILTTLRDRLFW